MDGADSDKTTTTVVVEPGSRRPVGQQLASFGWATVVLQVLVFLLPVLDGGGGGARQSEASWMAAGSGSAAAAAAAMEYLGRVECGRIDAMPIRQIWSGDRLHDKCGGGGIVSRIRRRVSLASSQEPLGR